MNILDLFSKSSDKFGNSRKTIFDFDPQTRIIIGSVEDKPTIFEAVFVFDKFYFDDGFFGGFSAIYYN